MLVTFKSDAYANIMMFGDAAHRLLKMMGHSGTIPSAILAEDVPAALDRLKRAIEEGKSRSQEPGSESRDTDADDQTISLTYRAIPLIELLTAAAKKHCDVMWDKV
jgi:hypothetical protein